MWGEGAAEFVHSHLRFSNCQHFFYDSRWRGWWKVAIMKRPRAGRLQRRAISKIEKPLTSKECSWWEQFFLLSDQSWQKTSLTLRRWPRTQHWNSNVWGHTLWYCTPFHHLFPTCAVKYCRSRTRKMFCNILCRRVDENSVNIPLIVSRSHLSWNEELHFWMCSRLTRV